MRKPFTVWVFNTVLVLVLLSVMEVVSRLVLYYKYNRDFDSSLIIDNKYGNSTGLLSEVNGLVWGKSFSTDIFGCRNTSKPFSKKKKTHLYIGDSVAQGVGVDDTTNFIAYMAFNTDTINVLNCSMIGWSVDDYNNALDFFLRDTLTSDAISEVTVCWCINDIYGTTKTPELPALGSNGLLSKISAWLHQNYATYKALKLLITQNSSHYFKYDEHFYKDAYRVAGAIQSILTMKSKCDTLGVRFNVLLLPYRSTLINNRKASEDINAFSRQMVNALGSNCLNLNYLLQESINPKDFYLFADEIHFSERGHKWVAGELSKAGY